MNGPFNFGDLTPTRYFFSIAFILGVLFATISNQQNDSLWAGLVQWQLQTMTPMALLILSHVILLRFSVSQGLNRWLSLVLSGVVGASLFTPIAFAIDLWFEVEANPNGAAVTNLLQEWFGLMPPITISWVAINAPWVLGYQLKKPDLSHQDSVVVPDTELSADVKKEPSPEFMQLVEEDKSGRLMYLKSELHYLMVVTDQGHSLILYSLSDAVNQLASEAGLMVHRSYWVAYACISSFQRSGRQGKLIMIDGSEVPVSRSRLSAVKDALGAEKCS